jgi:hypothetical protein
MWFRFAIAGLFALLALAGSAVRAADHIECMDGRLGDAESAIIDRALTKPSKPGGPEAGASEAAEHIFEARAQACAYLNHWSDRATRTAVLHRHWSMVLSVVTRSSVLTDADRARIEAALEPKRAAYLALFSPSVVAEEAGGAAPPPPLDMFRDFRFVLRQANIADTRSARDSVEIWLYVHGMMDALAAAFAAE